MQNEAANSKSRQTDDSSSFSFKEKVINVIIPTLEGMIEKEEEHLSWLKSEKAPSELIKGSELHLSHFRQRHKEYIEYVASLF